MGSVFKPITKLVGGILGGDQPGTTIVNPETVKDAEVSDTDAASLDREKRRRAQLSGLSSTILGGAAGTQSSAAGKTLLGQ